MYSLKLELTNGNYPMWWKNYVAEAESKHKEAGVATNYGRSQDNFVDQQFEDWLTFLEKYGRQKGFESFIRISVVGNYRLKFESEEDALAFVLKYS
jgi:hypothetical protein